MKRRLLTREIRQWEEFYRQRFELDTDFSLLIDCGIADSDLDYSFLIAVPQGMTMNQVLRVMEKNSKVVTVYADLDGHVQDNDRATKHSYLALVRRQPEPDDDLLDKSASDLSGSAAVRGINLLERLLLGAWYFWETGLHLDIEHVTLCTGSRDFDGDIMGVNYLADLDMVEIQYYDPDDADAGMGTRQVTFVRRASDIF